MMALEDIFRLSAACLAMSEHNPSSSQLDLFTMATTSTPVGLDVSTETFTTPAEQGQTNRTQLDPFWEKIPWAHDYWKQFNMTAIPDGYHYAVASWMTFFGIVGTFGNLLVLWTFIKNRSLRTANNYLVINLALSDMLFSAVNGFPLLTISSINRVWSWGETCCKVYGFFGGMFGFLSINTLAAVAIDRYNVITKPLQAAHRMTKKRAMLTIAFVWVWSGAWAVPPLFGWGGYIPEGFQTDCTFDYLTQDISNITNVACMYIFGFFFPVGAIFYCYYTIVKSMFAHSKEMAATAKRMGATMTKADQEKRSEIKTAKVALITCASFCISWTPYGIVALIGIFFPHEKKMVTPVMSMIPVMFAKSSAAYNPIIYALSHPKFREELDKQFPWLLVCCKPDRKGLERGTTESRTGSMMSRTDVSDSGVPDALPMSRAVSQDTVATMVVEQPAGSANPAAGGTNQCT